MSDPLSTQSIELPPIHQSANEASLKAQAEHTNLVKISLILLIVGVVPNAYSFDDPKVKGFVLWLSALGLLISIVISFVLRLRKNDKIWFAARALAESVKTMSWRYVMSADPYRDTGKESPDIAFENDLRRVMQTEKEVFGSLRAASAGAAQITRWMRDFRAYAHEERLRWYVVLRIQDQQSWYSLRAESNSRAANYLFWVTIVFQLGALLSAVAYAREPNTGLHPAGFFSAIAAAVVAWNQLRRHDELAKAYSLASHELATILSQSGRVSGEVELAHFVGDAENAISREHTLWLARRDTR